VQVIKLLIMQSSPASRQLLPLRFKYSPQHPDSNTLSLCSSLSVRDQDSHPDKTKIKTKKRSSMNTSIEVKKVNQQSVSLPKSSKIGLILPLVSYGMKLGFPA
jgi:hypothetical protein